MRVYIRMRLIVDDTIFLGYKTWNLCTVECIVDLLNHVTISIITGRDGTQWKQNNMMPSIAIFPGAAITYSHVERTACHHDSISCKGKECNMNPK